MLFLPAQKNKSMFRPASVYFVGKKLYFFVARGECPNCESKIDVVARRRDKKSIEHVIDRERDKV